MNKEEWIIKGEVGISSQTIWSVMMGIEKSKQRCGWHYDTPKDPDDFSRCHKLIALFPEWRSRLQEVSNIFPKWTPFIREWDKLEQYFADYKPENGMYEFMQKLEDEAMLLDGWVQTGHGSWHRPD